MAQQANNRGRNATLDEKKRRAAGRKEHTPEREAISDQSNRKPMKGQTGGAGGPAPRASRESALTVGRSTRRARKR